MKAPSVRDDDLVRRVAARCPGLLRTAVELRDRYGWSVAKIAKHLEMTTWALIRRASKDAPDGRKCRVKCGRCAWTNLRPRWTATLRPCPSCGSSVRRGRLKPGRPPIAELLGVEATMLVPGYVSIPAWARMRAVGGKRSAEVAGMVLERWAAGEAIEGEWWPELAPPTRAEREARARAQAATAGAPPDAARVVIPWPSPPDVAGQTRHGLENPTWPGKPDQVEPAGRGDGDSVEPVVNGRCHPASAPAAEPAAIAPMAQRNS